MQSTDPGGPDTNQPDPGSKGSWQAAKSWMIRWRGSRRLVLVIVAIALLLDNMLLTVVGEFHKKNATIFFIFDKIKTVRIQTQIFHLLTQHGMIVDTQKARKDATS